MAKFDSLYGDNNGALRALTKKKIMKMKFLESGDPTEFLSKFEKQM